MLATNDFDQVERSSPDPPSVAIFLISLAVGVYECFLIPGFEANE
ncbi:MAG TPA: hypothetical protein VK636_16060 [Gemmatimonadaceae bacterium]|nr:hypothetical protein [Gemmatimonadaceae bacterium]